MKTLFEFTNNQPGNGCYIPMQPLQVKFLINIPPFQKHGKKTRFLSLRKFCSGEFCSWYKTSGKRSPRDWFHELFFLQILSEGTHGSQPMELWSWFLLFIYPYILGKGQVIKHCFIIPVVSVPCRLLPRQDVASSDMNVDVIQRSGQYLPVTCWVLARSLEGGT